ncbi:MAG: SAVED domain-containing protein [Actinomycetota bacterium]|jgi:hypothetical protein|nr:SAVED domain-containing protein [Actinomycetota bacterium]
MTQPRQPPGVNPLGPVFVSYRVSDGAPHALTLAWALRATGVPVWHDETDLPPGDTTRRLDEALAAGLSGAVLVVTPEIDRSTVVRDVELPALLELERTSDFTLAIASVIESPDRPSDLDFEAPDRLLEQPAGTLKRLKQYHLSSDADTAVLTHQMALQRMVMHARLRRDPLVIDLQTRAAPRAAVAEAGLVVRTRPPEAGHRAPPSEIWAPVATFLAELPKLVAESGASRVVVRGGAHLCVAFALGAALPVTSGWPLTVTDRSGDWRSEQDGPAVALVEEARTLDPQGRALAVAIDLVPGPAPIDTFESHLAATTYGASLRITLRGHEMIPPASAAATVAELSRRIRDAASNCQTNRVALFLRVPFPVALHLGRTLNTLTVDLFEWDDGTEPPVYALTVTVASGRGASPIIEIATTT